MSAQLPSTPKEFVSCFGTTITETLETLRSSNLSAEQKAIWKYSGGALFNGRPLNTAMIFMAGTSGAGKSSTINAFFDDPNLCPTSSTSSETKNPVLLQKTLNVAGSSQEPGVTGNLCFVDVPGLFDTDAKNEVANLASIQKFTRSRIELANRKEIAKSLPKEVGKIRKEVFPSAVLFVVRATDNRISGPDSFFSKSLKVMKSSADVIDEESPNLIIVLTHSMSIPPRRFTQALNEKRTLIQGIVRNIFGIQDVPVVPVENDPEGYDMEKIGDFYRLPNGELSHHNLFQAMMTIFQKSDFPDYLGRLLVGWYFNPNCPERKMKASVINSQDELSPEDLAEAGLNIQGQNVSFDPEHIVFPYNFQSLGYGYCPVTEEVKPVCLINMEGRSQRKILELGDSKFLIPSCIIPYHERTSYFRKLTFFDKEEYQSHMKTSYGIEAEFKLVVSASSQGRWVNSSSGSGGSSLISLVHEIQLAKLKLDNPPSQIKNKAFLSALNALPGKYNESTAQEFKSFFSKFGSHFIYEQAVGGAMRSEYTVENASISKERFEEIQASVSGMFKAFSAGANSHHSSNVNALRTVGVTNEHLHIYGGDPPSIVTLETLTKEDLDKWKQTVPVRPTELRGSIKLYPYYNLLESGEKYNVLMEATKDHLQATLEGRIKSVYAPTREQVSQQTTRQTQSQQPSYPRCFPRTTRVTTLSSEGKRLEVPIGSLDSASSSMELETLFLRKSANGKYKILKEEVNSKTTFCTYLDKKENNLFEYLVLHFDNGKNLIVSESHLIFQYIPKEQGLVVGKQAKRFKVGEMAIYTDPAGAGEIVTPTIQTITKELHVGAYAPLTMSGTFFADGFFVSSYAEIDSFGLAQLALFPLKVWSKARERKEKEGGSSVVQAEGIHPFAKFLMAFRKSFTSSKNN